MLRFVCLLLAGSCAAGAAVPESSRIERATARLLENVQATRDLPGASPGLAVVVVARGQADRVWVDGVADMRSGARVRADTPFYIASMTKAYVGLLAALLDAQGRVPLQATAANAWPTLPPGPAHAPLYDWLSHRVPLQNEPLTFRTAYTDDVPATDYPRLLAHHSVPREPGFVYDNLGYLVYGAVVQQRLGQDWRDALRDRVLDPLRLHDSSARRRADFEGRLAAAHQWSGAGWVVRDPKHGALLHAAGGMYVSPRDLAGWLRAQLSPQDTPLGADVFEASRHVADYPMQSRNALQCDGYAPGWHRCAYRGVRIHEHGGSYDGFRSLHWFAPEAGVGFGFLSNSDSMTGTLGAAASDAFLAALFDEDSTPPDPAAFRARHAAQLQAQLEGRRAARRRMREDPAWGGWRWRPDAAELAGIGGGYENGAYGRVEIDTQRDPMQLRLGVTRWVLQPARPGLFGAVRGPFDEIEPVALERDAAGSVTAIHWRAQRFARADHQPM